MLLENRNTINFPILISHILKLVHFCYLLFRALVKLQLHRDPEIERLKDILPYFFLEVVCFIYHI